MNKMKSANGRNFRNSSSSRICSLQLTRIKVRGRVLPPNDGPLILLPRRLHKPLQRLPKLFLLGRAILEESTDVHHE
jgi:hypothetical protein